MDTEAFRNSLTSPELEMFDEGYRHATRVITEVLKKIIESAQSSDDVVIDVTGLVLGNIILMSGGTIEEAMHVLQTVRDL